MRSRTSVDATFNSSVLSSDDGRYKAVTSKVSVIIIVMLWLA
jgi:hypothetical protein